MEGGIVDLLVRKSVRQFCMDIHMNTAWVKLKKADLRCFSRFNAGLQFILKKKKKPVILI